MWVERARTAIRSVGEILITLGLVLFLFCAYQLFYTNVVADEAMKSEVSDLHKLWAEPPAARRRAAPTPPPFDTADSQGTAGAAFAILHIPRLGGNRSRSCRAPRWTCWAAASATTRTRRCPAGSGNFAVAGHRKTHGEPFRYLDEMRAGDLIVVETADTWYTYREDRDPFIVDPADLGVVAPVPDHPGATPSRS